MSYIHPCEVDLSMPKTLIRGGRLEEEQASIVSTFRTGSILPANYNTYIISDSNTHCTGIYIAI